MDKLTKRTVDSAPAPERKEGDTDAAYRKRWSWLADGEVGGFGAKVYATGRTVFALRYRTEAGRQRMLTIGTFGELTVQEARDMARASKVAVLDGADPQAEKEKKRESLGLPTVKALMKAWVKEYAKPHRKRWTEDRYRCERHILPSLGRVRLEDVAVDRLSRWHRGIGEESPVEANRCLETLRAAWRWAEDMERLPPGAADSKMFKGGRRAKIKRFRESSRTRWLNDEELKRLMAAVKAQEDAHVRAAVPLLVLTGLRKRELLTAKWEDLDLDRGELRLPDTKTGEEQRRLLPPGAVAILRELPRMDESPYIFPSPADTSKPRDDLKRPWKSIRAAAKLEDVTMHDLRRTAGSLMAQRGVPIEHIGQVLGHSRNTAVTRIYARLSDDNRRDALATLSAALAPVLGLDGGQEDTEAAPDLPDQLRELIDATKDDPEALSAGLAALGLGNPVEA